MFWSLKLSKVALIMCFGILVANPGIVCAQQGGPLAEILENVQNIQETLDNQVIPQLSYIEPRTPISSLPFTIETRGSYYLTGDLTSSGGGITVDADDVKIDLMGFTLIGSGTGEGINITGQRNVQITNGTVQGFYDGIKGALWPISGKDHRIVGVHAVMNSNNGVELPGEGHIIKDCVAWGNGWNGISSYYGSTVIGNTAYENAGFGISAGAGSQVMGNTAYRNEAGGISGWASSVIYNTAYENKATEFYGGHGIIATSSTVIANTAYKNEGSGIYSGGEATVTNNTVYDNGGDGISVSWGGTVNGNTSFRNGASGITGGHYCTIINNTVSWNNEDEETEWGGIVVRSNSLVKNNTAVWNTVNNIYVIQSDNAIEENLVTNSTNGIKFDTGGNFYDKNRARNNATNFGDPGGNTDGGANVSF